MYTKSEVQNPKLAHELAEEKKKEQSPGALEDSYKTQSNDR
jgi:hypothetical protein